MNTSKGYTAQLVLKIIYALIVKFYASDWRFCCIFRLEMESYGVAFYPFCRHIGGNCLRR